MSAGKYDALTFVEHDLYGPTLEPKHQMNDRMSVMNKGIMTPLSYNTNYGAGTKWYQCKGTGFTLNADMRVRETKDGLGSDPTKLGRLTWSSIGGEEIELIGSLFQHNDRVTAQTAHIRYDGSKQGTLKNMQIFETRMFAPFSSETCASSWGTSVMTKIMLC